MPCQQFQTSVNTHYTVDCEIFTMIYIQQFSQDGEFKIVTKNYQDFPKIHRTPPCQTQKTKPQNLNFIYVQHVM